MVDTPDATDAPLPPGHDGTPPSWRGEIERLDAAIADERRRAGPQTWQRIADARRAQGDLLARHGHDRDALARYADALRHARESDAGDQETRRFVASVHLARGPAFGRLEQFDDEIAEYARITRAIPPGDPDPLLRRIGAAALLNGAITFHRTGRTREALAGYVALTARHRQDPDENVRAVAARSALNRAFLLGHPAPPPAVAEHAALDDLIALFGDDPADPVREVVAAARVQRAVWIYRSDDDHAPARRAFLDAYHAIREPWTPELRRQHAQAGLTAALIAAEDAPSSPESVHALDELIATHAPDADPAVREIVANARLVAANLLLKRRELGTAAARFAETFRYALDPLPDTRRWAALAALALATVMDALGHPDDAQRLRGELRQRLGHDPDPRVAAIARQERPPPPS